MMAVAVAVAVWSVASPKDGKDAQSIRGREEPKFSPSGVGGAFYTRSLHPASTGGASLVADTYCSEAVLLHPTRQVDFDCRRSANASTAAVKVLGSNVASAAACHALCADYDYRGLPCRSYTYFAASHPRPNFRSRCYGRVDDLLPSAPDADATSGSLQLPDCSTASHCELNGRCRSGGTCDCVPGWSGRHCEMLDLRPARPDNGYRRSNYSSWYRDTYSSVFFPLLSV